MFVFMASKIQYVLIGGVVLLLTAVSRIGIRIHRILVFLGLLDPDPDPPDPRVFGPPGSGSGSISQRYGSGSGSKSF
jgi:hypothetical protein